MGTIRDSVNSAGGLSALEPIKLCDTEICLAENAEQIELTETHMISRGFACLSLSPVVS